MNKTVVIAAALVGLPLLSSCNAPATSTSTAQTPPPPVRNEAPEWFLLRPEVEKAYGYAPRGADRRRHQDLRRGQHGRQGEPRPRWATWSSR